jgi:hypothetical protein
MRITLVTAAVLIATAASDAVLGSPTRAPINIHGPTMSFPGYNYLTVEPLTEQGSATIFLNGALLARHSWTDKGWFNVPLPIDLSGTNSIRVDVPPAESISRQLIVLPREKVSSAQFPQVRASIEPMLLKTTKLFHPTISSAYLESFVCTAPRQMLGFIRDHSGKVEDIATLFQYRGEWVLIDYSPIEKH